MENNNWLKAWKSIDNQFRSKSGEELEFILKKRIRKTISWYFYLSLTAFIVSVASIIFLVHASIRFRHDTYYIINNILMGSILLIAVGSSVWGMSTVRYKFEYPLKKWLETRISYLRKNYNHKVLPSFFITPVVFFLMFMSIHVYWSESSYMGTFEIKDEEELWGMIVGLTVGLAVGIFVSAKIRKHGKNALNKLTELYSELNREES